MIDTIEVVAGVLRDAQGRILLAQRPEGSEHAGLWEFPGGKCECAESSAHALRRELHEELGIRIGNTDRLLSVPWRYANKSVRLDVLEVRSFSGTPHGHQGQALAWVEPAQLPSWEMPAADLPAAAVLNLPRTYAITADPGASVENLLAHARDCLAGGVGLLQLRAGSLQVRLMLQAARELAGEFPHARILLNADPDQVAALDGVGVHLNSARLRALHQRPLPRGRLVSASCHGPQDLGYAVALGCDFVTVSPVSATRSHPDAQVLGWDGLAAMIAEVPIAVFALGGMVPQDLLRARAAGAFGVAGISAFGC